jgi:hypothetical protein
MTSVRRSALLVAIAVAAVASSSVAGAKPVPIGGAKAFFWPRTGVPAQALARAAALVAVPHAADYNDLLFHGGVIERVPSVYLVFWGAEWKKGFRTSDGDSGQVLGFPIVPPTTGPHSYTGAQAISYLTKFFASIGGSRWNGTQTQYCDGVPLLSTSCEGVKGARFITNPANLLKGVWIDPSPVTDPIITSGLAENITHDPIASEAVKAAAHFGGGTHPDATYFIMTPPGHVATAYGSVYCAYHSEVANPGGHGIRYAFIPYVMEQGAGCAQYGVNKKADAFGHGFFDPYSIVAGHEFAEAETDPDAFPFQDGWNDYQTSENGDKCAYFDLQNIRVGPYYFAVQPLWSNEANSGKGGCAVSRGKGKAPIPPVTSILGI